MNSWKGKIILKRQSASAIVCYGLSFAFNRLNKKKVMETNSLATAKKILVVDDEPDIRDIIMYVLESEGYQVCGLDNGAAVIDTVQQIQPDIVLLDVQLGDRDGRDICRELKAQPATQHIPVIMISANQSWPTLREKQCNPDDFLSKPFDLSELIDHVKRFAA
jgi:DNA-binding response OmpR family regulator